MIFENFSDWPICKYFFNLISLHTGRISNFGVLIKCGLAINLVKLSISYQFYATVAKITMDLD
jgi:hypothetical protein